MVNSCFPVTIQISTLFCFKDILDKEICSNLVYRYSCSSSSATTRITINKIKTDQHFFTRAEEQMRISNLTDKHFKNVKESVFFDHLLVLDSLFSRVW